MWPSIEWWSERGYTAKDEYLYKWLPNGWEIAVSTPYPSLPLLPPINDTLAIVVYEPDGNTATFQFSMQRDCSLNPDTMLAALLKTVEDQVFNPSTE